MRRWLLIFVLFAGCESANPVTPEPEPPVEMTFDHVPVEELNVYLNAANEAFGPIEIFYTEYGGVTGEATVGLVSTYWTRQYTQTMIRRIHAILAMLHDMRPENSYLRRLHIEEFEAAFHDYLEGVTFFQENVDFLSNDILNGINQRMGAGNVHIIRLQIFLSDLAGFPVFLGTGGGPPGEGQDFGL